MPYFLDMDYRRQHMTKLWMRIKWELAKQFVGSSLNTWICKSPRVPRWMKTWADNVAIFFAGGLGTF
jgi:hypothetical protein